MTLTDPLTRTSGNASPRSTTLLRTITAVLLCIVLPGWVSQSRGSSTCYLSPTGSDSAGLALLIEWLSVAKAAGRALRYENVPSQLDQLARLSELDSLISAA